MAIIEREWYAVRVKSRHEKSCAKNFELREISYFLPTYRSKQRWSDRIKEVELPLFPGYIFCSIQAPNFWPILATPGVVQIIGRGSAPEPVAPEEIAAVQKLVANGGAVPWPYLESGQRVRLTDGAFRGLEGILHTQDGKDRVVVNVKLLHKAVAVEVDRGFIEPCR